MSDFRLVSDGPIEIENRCSDSGPLKKHIKGGYSTEVDNKTLHFKDKAAYLAWIKAKHSIVGPSKAKRRDSVRIGGKKHKVAPRPKKK